MHLPGVSYSEQALRRQRGGNPYAGPPICFHTTPQTETLLPVLNLNSPSGGLGPGWAFLNSCFASSGQAGENHGRNGLEACLPGPASLQAHSALVRSRCCFLSTGSHQTGRRAVLIEQRRDPRRASALSAQPVQQPAGEGAVLGRAGPQPQRRLPSSAPSSTWRRYRFAIGRLQPLRAGFTYATAISDIRLVLHTTGK